jgi:hypothetical protein
MRASPSRVLGIAVVVLCGVAFVLWNSAHPAFGRADQQSSASAATHYSVVMTEGHNLLVTDNASNTIYFYTIDKDKPIGSPLKLRASLDLTKVGQQEIEITKHNLEK